MPSSGAKPQVTLIVVTVLAVVFLGVVAPLLGSITTAVMLWLLAVGALVLFIQLIPSPSDETLESRRNADIENAGDTTTSQSQISATTSSRSSRPTRNAENATDATDDALDHLRRRYADGSVSEAQFERGVERLLAAEGSGDEAIVALRNRYARGKLTDEQFDRKYRRLRATSTVENAEESVEYDAFSSEDEYSTES